jgi:C1A family cysteine protease
VFIQKQPQGIYQLPPQFEGEGHAVTLIGYNNTGAGYWIVKNSFGPKWGDQGFFKVPPVRQRGCNCLHVVVFSVALTI